MTQVTIQNLSKQYTNHLAVDQLSLAIPSGKITALLGPSGCGKTTTLKMVAGLLSVSEGDILFDGASVLATSAENRGAVMVFQNHLLFPHMNVLDNVSFGLRMQKVPKEERYKKAEEMLALVQLGGLGKRKPAQLSGGQQQRVALARALVVSPQVLLLDEPLSNLDAHLRDEMRSLILDVQQKTGVTTIVVTHDQEEAVVLAHQIALMFDGRLAQFAEPKQFYTQPASHAVAQFFGGKNFLTGTVTETGMQSPEAHFSCTVPSRLTTAEATIRPEQIEIVSELGINCFQTTVTEILFLGNHTRIRTRHPETGLDITVTAHADVAERYTAEDVIILHLPPEKIWVFG